MKKLMYINLITVAESSEDIEQLPIITIIDDGITKHISKGLEEVEVAILEIAEYLGQDHSELIPFAVEEREGDELTLSFTRRQRKRRRQGGAG